MNLATIIGYLSGLRFVAPDLDAPTVLGTALALHVCEAIVRRLFAHNNGYPKNLWTLLGFIGGLWAVAVLILLPRRGDGERSSPGPSSTTTEATAPVRSWLSATSQRTMRRWRASSAARPWRTRRGGSPSPRTTSKSCQVTPALQPVPSAFMAASLA